MATCTTSSTQSDKVITLRVGDRTFTTRLGTLTEGSSFLAAKFSDRWNTTDASASTPGDIPFLDADGDAFAHVLEYLRNRSYPLLWDAKEKTFDVGLYGRVAALARYLMVNGLATWIDSGRFQQAAEVTIRTQTVEGQDLRAGGTLTVGEIVEQQVVRVPCQVHHCPRGEYIHVHRKQCFVAGCDRYYSPTDFVAKSKEERECFSVLLNTKTIKFNMEILR